MTRALLSIMWLAAAFLALTAFTNYQDNLSPKDAEAYQKHSVRAAFLCGSNDLKNSCYAHRMAKWLSDHGYRAQSAIMLAELEHYPQQE